MKYSKWAISLVKYPIYHFNLFLTKQTNNLQFVTKQTTKQHSQGKPVLEHCTLYWRILNFQISTWLTKTWITQLLFLSQGPVTAQNYRLDKTHLSCFPNYFLTHLENCFKCIWKRSAYAIVDPNLSNQFVVCTNKQSFNFHNQFVQNRLSTVHRGPAACATGHHDHHPMDKVQPLHLVLHLLWVL